MDRQWVARRYQSGDEARILELRRLVFGDRDEQRNTERYWQWEFRDNPAGHGRIWLAVAADEVVGQFAVIPLRMQYRGEVVVGSLCLEVMTHADYRREGVFTTLGRKLHEELERENIPVTLGFPNRNSVEGLISKLDWIYVRSLPVFVKPLDAARITERLVTNRMQAFPIRSVPRLLASLLSRPDSVRLGEGIKIAWIERFDSRVDSFWERLGSKYPIAVVRDSTHLNWRYHDNPGREYRILVAERGDEILGYMIVRCMEQFDLRGGMIVDVVTLPDREPVLAALLVEAEKLFREQQMDLAACLVSGDDNLVKMLRKHGFLPIARKLGFKEWHFECRLNSPALPREFFGEPTNWFLTFGDTDII